MDVFALFQEGFAASGGLEEAEVRALGRAHHGEGAHARHIEAIGDYTAAELAAEEAAERSTQWDLHDDRGNRVPAGIYFVHLASGDFHQTRKVTVMR